MSTSLKRYISPEEYLARERRAEGKSEYFAGEMFAMVGASRAHIRIVKNLIVALDQRLSGSFDVASTDLRVFIPSTGLYTYSNLIVTCGKEEFADAESDTLLNPLAIIEVLSKGTQEYDRGLKFASYRTIQSLREYVMIAQDSARAECWRIQPNGIGHLLSTAVWMQ